MMGSDIFKGIYIFVIAFITDTYAYISGMLIGKHKLTPISPKKTIEGSVTGLIVAAIIGTFFYLMFINKEASVPVLIAIVAVLSIAGQLGDLFFSLIKRENDIKDYSNLIPGHGGILDRFDSVIFVSLGMLIMLNIL